MYLKSIEIQGFKSFANKILLEFHNGITAIVGPNGSGKSNISDAVRWVLGEQSAKQLRGASMQDVIFAGTAERKPLSYAYVAITMDNSDHCIPVDYEEVTVARRVYRSGESEYLLNGSSCRLKDIQEMFYDTGIGKEGYSIIGQGQIERILSGKPEERRELFDEAVGIVKFKKRKAAAQKKLAEEQDNLTRVSDILHELESRVGPLEKQAADAKVWLKLKDEQKGLDVNLFLLESRRIEKELAEIDEKLSTAGTSLAEQQAAAEQMHQAQDEAQEALAACEAQLDELRKNKSESALVISRLENEIALAEEKIRSAQASDESLGARKGAIEYEKENHEAQLALRQEEHARLSAELQEVEDRCAEQVRVHDEFLALIAAAEQSIEEKKAENLRLLEEEANLRSRREALKAMGEQIRIRQSQIASQLLAQQSEQGDVLSQLEAARAQLENAEAEHAKRTEEARALDERKSGWEEKRREAAALFSEAQEQFHRASTQMETLRNLAERYEGYNLAIRSVMEQKDSHPGILGVVSDLIVAASEYEVAIETALGGNIQNIVTADEASAKEMVSYLKKNRLGRATFLPLTAVDRKPNPKLRDYLREPGVIGIADELVTCDDRFRGVARYLLGRCLVVSEIDSAIALAKKSGYSVHIVTLEGEYLSPGGSISGGRYKNNSNLLGRRRELEELESRIASLKETMAAQQHRMDEVDTALELLADDRLETAAALQEALLNRNSAQIRYEQAEEEQKKGSAASMSLTEEKKSLEEQMTQIADETAGIDQKSAGNEQNRSALNKESETLAASLASQREEETRLSDAVSKVRMEAAAVRQRLAFEEENIARIEDELKKDGENLHELLRSAEEAHSQIASRQKDIEEIRKTIEQANQNQQKLDAAMEEQTAARDKANDAYRKMFDRREELSADIHRLDKEVFRLTQSKERASANLEAQTHQLWDEYELTPHAAAELASPQQKDRAQMKKRLSEIREEIRALGNVNVNAIEEFAEVNERYTFLSGQHADLEKARETLLSIIEDLDEGMRRQFTEGFAQIRKEFDAAFKELFGGGQGTLELVEDEDILETGIRIIAQPPGKKLQNMMQLSGGEKALTAIALLFAIQNMKPSPFALLDEIEAALDDSNVDRYAQYLHKLTKNTQFIVITHRRGTMNAADRLYGITMQERGISTLVSVNLVEADLT